MGRAAPVDAETLVADEHELHGQIAGGPGAVTSEAPFVRRSDRKRKTEPVSER